MKRDWNRYREIILYVEEHADAKGTWIDVPVELSDTGVADHVIMLEKDGMIDVQDNRSKTDNISIYPTDVTAKGREFCELSRMDKTWSEALSAVSHKTGTVTLELLIKRLRETNEYLLNKN